MSTEEKEIKPADAETSTEEKEVKEVKEVKKGKPVKKWKLIVTFVLLFLFTFLTAAVLWALGSWSLLTMDELLWHLKVSLKGTNPDMIWSFVLICGGSAIGVTGLAAFLLFLFRKEPKTFRRVFRISFIASFVILAVGLVSGWFGLGIGPFLKDYFTVSPYITDNYVDPGTVKLTFPEKKRNLIVIYMESMEMTFMDGENGGAFPENVIPELTVLAKDNEDFSGKSEIRNGGIALPGAIWTMGALFGTTTGLPLKTPMGQNGMSIDDDFFPGVVNLGDILKKEGYNNRLIMGSAAGFGGCRHFYESHGDFTIHDYDYAIDTGLIPENYKVWWGYEDEKVFQYARDELLELAQGDQPFQLVLQTMDTHFEDGHWCRNCTYDFGDNRYANIMHCSSRMVAEFVHWIQKQDFYENTTILITGDHPTMDKNFCDDVPETYQRKTFTCIINPAVTAADPDKTREFSTFDLFPTTLAALGVKIDGERLGLGTNLYSDMPTLIEQNGLESTTEEISKHSRLMDDMYMGRFVSPFFEGSH